MIITQGHSTENAPNSGVVIAELGNGGSINLEESNFRLQPNGITTQEEIQGVFRGGLDNPLTGDEMDSIQDILDYMKDSGQTNYSFYSNAVSIEDLDGNTIPTGTFVHLRGVNGNTYTMEWVGNFTRVMYWIVGTTQTRSRTSYLNGVLQTGNVRPDTDNSRDIGSGTLRYDDIFATNGAINTSDEREKDVSEIPESWYEAAKNTKAVRFKWKDCGVRWHIGYSAQQAFQALSDAGVEDPWSVAYMCKDTLTEDLIDGSVKPLLDEEGNQIERWGLRYEELNTLKIAAFDSLPS